MCASATPLHVGAVVRPTPRSAASFARDHRRHDDAVGLEERGLLDVHGHGPAEGLVEGLRAREGVGDAEGDQRDALPHLRSPAASGSSRWRYFRIDRNANTTVMPTAHAIAIHTSVPGSTPL